MESYQAIEDFILKKLKEELPADLYYHSVYHTRDVVKAAELIAAEEKISEDDLFLLKVAALYHDSGFIHTYKQHEEESCRIARAMLPVFGLDQEQIKIICGMIMATKIPQKPHTQLEKIIADADLLYLGSDDYDGISDSLFEEIKIYLHVTDLHEWKEIQINFLSQHHYHTDYCKTHIAPGKQKHLDKIKSAS
jgi:uncharacterized protein